MDLLFDRPASSAHHPEFLKLSEQDWMLLVEEDDLNLYIDLDELHEPPLLEEWNGGNLLHHTFRVAHC